MFLPRCPSSLPRNTTQPLQPELCQTLLQQIDFIKCFLGKKLATKEEICLLKATENLLHVETGFIEGTNLIGDNGRKTENQES